MAFPEKVSYPQKYNLRAIVEPDGQFSAENANHIKEKINKNALFHGVHDDLSALQAAFPEPTPGHFAYLLDGSHYRCVNVGWTTNEGNGPGSSYFYGYHLSLADLIAAHPNAIPGARAIIKVVGGNDQEALWDEDDEGWFAFEIDTTGLADTRLSNVASDLTEAEKSEFKEKIGAEKTDIESEPFITKWNIATDGEALQMPPLSKTTSRNEYVIDWGDGTIEKVIGQSNEHIYTTAGVYEVKIKGFLEDFVFTSPYTHKNKLVEVVSFGDIDWEWISFHGASNLTILANEKPNFERVSVLTDFLNGCNISSVSGDLFRRAITCQWFDRVFKDNTNLTTVPSNLFYNCVAAVTFAECFRNCGLTSVPEGLFQNCLFATGFYSTFRDNSLTAVPVDLFRYNQKVESFNSTFMNNSIDIYPAGIFRYNLEAISFPAVFAGNTVPMTGVADPIWLRDIPATANMFDTLPDLDNWAEIPMAWGGGYDGTYPQVLIRDYMYWNEDLQKPQWLVNGVWKDVDGSAITGGKATGNALVLSNIAGNNYNYAAPSDSLSYTTSSPTVNGLARCFINAPSEPVVYETDDTTPATKIAGATFVADTLMELVVESPNGVNVRYFFLEI